MNWTVIAENVGGVALILGPVLVAHYRKIAAVLESVTQILDAVTAAEKVVPTPVSVSAPITETDTPMNGGSAHGA